MNPLVQVAIVGLASWRVAAFLVYEDGPGGIFERFRVLMGIPSDGGEIHGFFPLLLSCIWCTSVWAAFLMGALWYVHWTIPGFFAACAVAIAMERVARP